MSIINYSELKMLRRGAEKALFVEFHKLPSSKNVTKFIEQLNVLIQMYTRLM